MDINDTGTYTVSIDQCLMWFWCLLESGEQLRDMYLCAYRPLRIPGTASTSLRDWADRDCNGKMENGAHQEPLLS